ncbi:MAG: 16S rRNA (guanine(527)-N(7))-methyltransferase RsmG [Nitrospiria bacterium]
MHRLTRLSPKQILLSGTSQLGLNLSSIQIEQVIQYLSELIRWNQKINLSGLREAGDIMIRHILDSLTPLTLLKPEKDSNWIDIGTGAGLPGLILIIASPEIKMTLVEPNKKKAAFLHHVIGLIGLGHVTVINDRIEYLSEKCDGRYDLLLTRALSPSVILEKGVSLVKKKGKILFFQGHPEKETWEKRIEKSPQLHLETIRPITLPFCSAPRTLVLLKVCS